MIPGIDAEVGIKAYSTGFAGTGGCIRCERGDFVVSEVISEKAKSSIGLDDNYAVYRLSKDGIDTNHALADIFRKNGLRLRALGLKDASAQTEQFVCAAKKGPGVHEVKSGRYSLVRLGYTARPLSKGMMVGNRFRITVRGGNGKMGGFSEHSRILNFYGYQRFGSGRPVTHLIGRAMVQGDFGKAVSLLLSFSSPRDTGRNAEIRAELADPANYPRLAGRLPRGMDIEAAVLGGMVKHGDAKGALRAAPLQMRRFYVQAYQSYIFNLVLSGAFQAGEDLFAARDGDVCFDGAGVIGKYAGDKAQRLAVPLVGHSYYKKTRFGAYIAGVLEQEEVSPADFFIKEMQEAGGEGGFRQAAASCTGFAVSGSTASFTLSRGSFATILMREIIKPKDPIAAGF